MVDPAVDRFRQLPKEEEKEDFKHDQRFRSMLLTHVLTPEFMYSNDFKGFFLDRKEQILKRIETAMSKMIPRDVVDPDASVIVKNGYKTEVGSSMVD